jgi:hypothetical protein
MRGVEIGLRSLVRHLNIPFPDLDLEQQKVIINTINKEIKDLEQKLHKGAEKAEELRFCSDAALQFRYFKDAYRNDVSHSRTVYNESEAEKVMRGTTEFLQILSTKLKE